MNTDMSITGVHTGHLCYSIHMCSHGWFTRMSCSEATLGYNIHNLHVAQFGAVKLMALETAGHDSEDI